MSIVKFARRIFDDVKKSDDLDSFDDWIEKGGLGIVGEYIHRKRPFTKVDRIKECVNNQLKELSLSKEEFCQIHGYDYSNFSKKEDKIIRDIQKAQEILSKLDIQIFIKPSEKISHENSN